MIKLSKAQIEALASRIIDGIKQPAKEYNQKIQESDDYKLFFERNADCIELQRIQKKYKLDSYDINRLQGYIRTKEFEGKFKPVPHVNQGAVETEIILMTIESEDLNKLIEAVSNKFKTND